MAFNSGSLKPLENANFYTDIGVANKHLEVNYNDGTIKVLDGSEFKSGRKTINDSNQVATLQGFLRNHFTTYDGKLQLKRLGGSQDMLERTHTWYQ